MRQPASAFPGNFPELSRDFPARRREISRMRSRRPQSAGEPHERHSSQGLGSPSPFLGAAPPAFADVITDWNDQAVAFGVKRNMLPPPAERIIAMTQVAMFDAVNSIERKYTALSGAASGGRRVPRARRRRRPPPARAGRHQSAGAGRDEGRAGGLSREPFPTVARQDRRHQARRGGRRKSARGAAERRRQRAGHLSAAHHGPASTCRPRRPGAAVAGRQAVRVDQRVAVPAGRRRSRSQRRSGPPTTTR